MADKLNINQWAEEDRPRERLMAQGAEALTNAELLAILIGSGSPEESAVDLMKRVLADCHNNLNTLGKMPLRELTAYKGLGPAKAVTLLAACELGKRRALEKAEERLDLKNSADIYAYMHPKMQDLDLEEAWVLLLNSNFKLIKAVRLSHGGMTETVVDVRLILKEALLAGATVAVLCHNHPSGNPKPSRMDDDLTTKVRTACEAIRIYLADHLVITDGQYFSYRDEGRL